MHTDRNFIRRLSAAGALALVLVPLGACDSTRQQLLEADTPDIINP